MRGSKSVVTCEEQKNEGSQGGKVEAQMNREPPVHFM